MNQFISVPKVFDMFIILTDLTKVFVEFCVLKFSSFGAITMDEGIRSGKEPKLGDSQGTPRYILGRLKHLSLGMPRKASPLSSQSIGMSLGAIFLFVT